MQGSAPYVKFLMILLIIGLFTPLAAQGRDIVISNHPSQLKLQNSSDYGFDLHLTIDEYHLQRLDSKAGSFDEISIKGYGFSSRIGEAQLPVASRIVAVPLGAEVHFEILSQEKHVLSSKDSGLLHSIFPAQAPVSKSADLSKIPFIQNAAFYARSEFKQNPTFRMEEIGMLRGLRLFQFYYEPIRYNPVSQALEIVSTAEIKVEFRHPDLAATNALWAKTASPEFEALYSKSIFNYEAENRASLVRYPTKMIILCPAAYSSTMQSYIEWKRKEGFIVNFVTVGSGAEVANSTSAIKTYMQTLWDSATAQNPAPTYLLIVGDHGTTGNNITANVGQTDSAHITDFSYVRLNGTDYLPEMYHGRFSVSSSTELQNVINKTLMFAKTSMPDLSYLGKTVLIAGVDGSYAPTHGNGAINYATTHYVNTAHGITSNNYLYPASGSSAAAIRANAAEGRAYLNYTAHGSQTSWADPSFTAAQMTTLSNVNKPFVAVGNCCITNEFDYSSPCFGEAIIRAPNAGAAYIGGINSTYWNEDYYWSVGFKTPQTAAHPYDPNRLGAYDASFQAPNSVADWAQTTGETVFMGNMAVQASTTSLKNYYWEIYHIMGDPSLMPYYGVPAVNTATFPPAIMLGLDSINITATPYSRVALSMNGILYASQIVPASGSTTLTFTPFSNTGTADLVITRSGKITRQESIQILPASGAYMTVQNNVYADNNNNQPDYNESGRFNTTFKNVGASAVSNVTATLSSTTAGINITDATESISSLAAGATLTRSNAFAFTIADNIVNGTVASFTITMVSGSNTWTHAFDLTLNAPALSFGSFSISDASGNNNGRLDPGETVTITMPILNEGGATSAYGSATLSCSSFGITIHTATASFAAINTGGTQNLSFSISAAASMSIGSIANLNFNATAAAYTATKIETLTVGLILEDFESGNFSSFPWTTAGNLAWTVVNSGAYQGIYAAKSGAITHNQSSTMQTTRILSTAGNISFRYKLSSESGYDKLKFYVDGVQKGEFSGNVGWTEASYPLSTGSRELSWTYSKDGSVSNGDDCAWIDYIVFPASTAPSNFFPAQNLTAIPGNGHVILNWDAPNGDSPTSYRVFRNGSLLTTVTALSYQDNAVSNETTYSYYILAVYTGGVSDPSNTVQATPSAIVPTELIIGNGSSSTGTSTASPINIYYQSLHGQAVYTAAELNTAGLVGSATITQIGFKVTGLPSQGMPNYIVRMAHSSASNVSSWVLAGLTTVFNAASYQPNTIGWNMLTLDPPFEWNGIDNILVDTAFGLIGAWNSSGTVEYTAVTNGYRFGRSDSSNQTNVFTGGSTSTSRPNLKLHIIPIAPDAANIVCNPSTMNYAATPVGQSSSQSLRISNSGSIALTGSISSPAGFSLSQRDIARGSKAERNTLNFSIAAHSYQDFAVLFSPSSAANYSGNIVVSSNATNSPALNIPISGIGYIPPTISVNTDALSARLLIGEQGSDTFSISNTGSQQLNFNIALSPVRHQFAVSIDQRNITGSSLSVAPESYQSGTTVDWAISVYNASTDAEWMSEVILNIPAGVMINSASGMNCVSGDLDATIAGNTITWFGTGSSGWGIIQGNQTGLATINVSIPAGFAGDMALAYTLNGDEYGGEPHSLSASCILTQDLPPVEWLSLNASSGSLAPGASTAITANFSAAGMNAGVYNAVVNISSNDPVHPFTQLDATLEVLDVSNYAPIITLPESFSFSKNGSLMINLADYASDPDNDPLSLQIVGNTNLLYNITGLMVDISAVPNWIGSETLTFIVSDGQYGSSAQAQIHVLPVNEPDWVPVNYPHNPATIYATVSVNAGPAMNNDWVAAFVGDECRASAQILNTAGVAYATLIVQLAAPHEIVYFRVYAYATDTIYDALASVEPDFGEEIGVEIPVEIAAGILSNLNQAVVSIQALGSSFELNWQPVLHAEHYEIFFCAIPDGTYQSLGSTANTFYPIDGNLARAFYQVIAIQGSIAK